MVPIPVLFDVYSVVRASPTRQSHKKFLSPLRVLRRPRSPTVPPLGRGGGAPDKCELFRAVWLLSQGPEPYRRFAAKPLDTAAPACDDAGMDEQNDIPDLGLNLTARDLGLRPAGAKGKHVTAVAGEVLVAADLAALETSRDTKAPGVLKLRERHHFLARSIADGMKPGDAGLLCGYCASRVSILQADKAFQDLVQFYRQKVDEKYYGMHERMAALGVDAVDELQERLDDTPDEFTVNQLMDLAGRMADRTGHGVSTQTNVNIKVGLADRLASARRRLEAVGPAAGEGPTLIEGTAEKIA